jgi:hypothetical protein
MIVPTFNIAEFLLIDAEFGSSDVPEIEFQPKKNYLLLPTWTCDWLYFPIFGAREAV